MKKIALILMYIVIFVSISVVARAETRTLNNISGTGGTSIAMLTGVKANPSISCTIYGNPNCHYRLELRYNGFFGYVNHVFNGVLANGSTTGPLSWIAGSGDYFVSIYPYDGRVGDENLTLVFTIN